MEEKSEPSEILEILKKNHYRLIAIDGVDGSGKSSLSKNISEELGYCHINLDEYLENNRGNFVKYIKYEVLENKIQSIKKAIIIEGVCVLAVLKNLGMRPDYLIYIKRISEFDFWKDDHLCDVKVDIDAFIENENLELQKFSEVMSNIEGEEFNPENSKIPKLREEIIRYHYEFKPHKHANLVYNKLTANKQLQGASRGYAPSGP